MTQEELDISRSTPSCRFDAPAPSATPAVPAPSQATATQKAGASPAVPDEVAAFVEQVLADPDQPLVMFALEWCEFCWSLRKLFALCGIPYRSVDLDSTAYQSGNRGGQIRGVLASRTGSRTIPQVFVGGEYIGGCTETIDMFKNGRLQRMLAASGVSFDADVRIDPDTLLPGWLHPR